MLDVFLLLRLSALEYLFISEAEATTVQLPVPKITCDLNLSTFCPSRAKDAFR